MTYIVFIAFILTHQPSCFSRGLPLLNGEKEQRANAPLPVSCHPAAPSNLSLTLPPFLFRPTTWPAGHYHTSVLQNTNLPLPFLRFLWAASVPAARTARERHRFKQCSPQLML